MTLAQVTRMIDRITPFQGCEPCVVLLLLDLDDVNTETLLRRGIDLAQEFDSLLFLCYCLLMTILNTTWDFLMNLYLYVPLPVIGALITFGRFGVPLVAGLVEAWNERD